MDAPVAAVPADVAAAPAIDVGHLPWTLAEPIALLFDLLGWRVLGAPAGAASPALAPAGACPARLVLRPAPGLILVTCADGQRAATLAAAGLDRLVLPPALPALEDLAALAA